MKEENSKTFWSDIMWILSYGRLKISLRPNENWKNSKLANSSTNYFL